MQENKRWTGYFFLPENPEEKVAGILQYKVGEKIELELIGSLKVKENFQFQKVPLINGIIDGKHVTLHKNYEVDYTLNISSNTRKGSVTYQSQFIFFGAKFDNIEELKFTKANFEFSYLEEWLNQKNAFKCAPSEDRKTLKVCYKNPDSISNKINGYNFQIKFGYKSSNISYYLNEFNIKQVAFISIFQNKEIKFDKILTCGLHFQKFLTLAMQLPIYARSINLYFKKDQETTNHCQLFYVSNTSKQEINRTNVLFQYNQVQNKFSSILEEWYSKREKLEITIDTFFKTYYSAGFSIDSFLNVMRALESYHREFINIDDINLKDKCTELFQRTKNIFNDYLKIQDEDEFCEEIKTYRHDLTHSNPIVKEQPYQHKEIFQLTEKVKLILLCNVLVDNCFSPTEIKHFIETSNVFNHIAG